MEMVPVSGDLNTTVPLDPAGNMVPFSGALANTIALGGVATGNIKAHEALMAAGIMISLGSMAAPIAPAARMGMSSVVVAVLLVVSVRNVTARHTISMMASSGSAAAPDRALPMLSLNPDAVKALAMAMPAPKRISMPHGIRSAVSQSSSLPPLPFGTRNITTSRRTARCG